MQFLQFSAKKYILPVLRFSLFEPQILNMPRNKLGFLNSIEYKLFPTCFLITTGAGFWLPSNLSGSGLGKTFYNVFTILIFSFCCIITGQSLALSVLNAGTKDFVMFDMLVSLILVTAIVKQIFLLVQRKKLLNFLESLVMEEWHQPQNEEERKIFHESSIQARW